MRDPKRILNKLFGKEVDLAPYEATGEPLDLFIEVLREVVKCRRTHRWLIDTHRIDVAINPQVFTRILDIPQINFVETATRTLEVETLSLKESRQATDPVTIGNLNSVLRELYRSLNEIHDSRQKNYDPLLLAQNISAENFATAQDACQSLRSLKSQVTGYLLSGFKAAKIDKQFKESFPDAASHPLRAYLDGIEKELPFYQACAEVNQKWRALELDMFPLLKENELVSVLENMEELGGLLWNLVYKQSRIQKSLALAGIDFSDIQTLFDPTLVRINNA
jgi:hypothetical protein